MMVIGGVVGIRLYFQEYTPQEISQQGVSSEVLSECRSELERLDRYTRSKWESARSRELPGQALHVVEHAIPSDVWLTELVVSDKRIDVVGLSRSESSVSTFVGAIVSSGAVHHANLQSSRMASGGQSDVREFHISGELAERELVTHD
jgi:Tfp pilus assembly protein PilN